MEDKRSSCGSSRRPDKSKWNHAPKLRQPHSAASFVPRLHVLKSLENHAQCKYTEEFPLWKCTKKNRCRLCKEKWVEVCLIIKIFYSLQMPNICTVVVVVVPYTLLLCFYAPFIALHKMDPYFNLNNLSQGWFWNISYKLRTMQILQIHSLSIIWTRQVTFGKKNISFTFFNVIVSL